MTRKEDFLMIQWLITLRGFREGNIGKAEILYTTHTVDI